MIVRTSSVLGGDSFIGRRRALWLSRDVLVLMACAIVVYPVVMLMLEPMGNLGELVHAATRIPRIGSTVVNTVVIGVACVAVAVPVGTVLAWSASLLSGKWQGVATAACVLPILMPPIASLIGWVFLFAPTVGYANQALRSIGIGSGDHGPVNIFSMTGIVLLTSVQLVPYVYLFVFSALTRIDRSGEDAARVAGSSWLGAQARVVLKSIRPAFAYCILTCLLLSLGQFTTVLILGRDIGVDVITTEMYRQTVSFPTNYPLAAFLGVPLIGIALLLVAAQRRSVGALERYAYGGKGVGRPRKPRRIALVPIVAFGVLATLPPLLSLVLVSFSPFWSGDIPWGAFTLQHVQTVAGDPQLVRAIVNTLKFSAVGTLLGLLLSALGALLLVRSSSRLKGTAEVVSSFPMALPPTLIGMGIFLAFAVGPINWYSSGSLFVIAFVILFLPFGLRLMTAAVSQVDENMVRAARTSGSTWLGAHLRVLLPLCRGGLSAAAMLMFILMTHEFAAASLLNTGRNEVMSTQLYFLWSDGTYPQVGVMSLLMIAVTAIGVVGALAVGGIKSLNSI